MDGRDPLMGSAGFFNLPGLELTEEGVVPFDLLVFFAAGAVP